MAKRRNSRPYAEEEARWRDEFHDGSRAATATGETSPLLGASIPSAHSHETWQPGNIRICIILLVMLAAVDTAGQIVVPAKTRIFESIFCADWYREHSDALVPSRGIDEHLCKIAAVQRQLSSLRAWIELWAALPGLFLAIPFGILADQVGRKWVLRASITVIFLRELWHTFVAAAGIPLWTVNFGSALNIVGGGNMVAEMMFCVVLTDITPRQKLPVVFFQLTAVVQFAKVLGPAICGGLMRLSPWYAVLVGLVLMFISSVLSFMVPETLEKVVKDDHASTDPPTGKRPLFTRVRETWATYVQSLRELIAIWADWRLIFLALLYPFRMMANALDEILQQYISLRYGWSLADATFLYSLQGCIASALLLLVLPWISTMIEERLHYSAIKQNVVIAQWSLALMALGFCAEGLAPTVQLLILALAILTLGSGGPPALRALAGVLVEQEDNGRVFSGLAISESLSVISVYPLSAALFNAGIEKGGGMWLGMPFLATGVGLAVVVFIMCFLRFESREMPGLESAILLQDD